MRRDNRSDEARAYRKLYGTSAWSRLRYAHLSCEPFCRFCRKGGVIRVAEVVDHVEPHKGDRAMFFDANNLQSLCRPCHDRVKQAEETRGFAPDIGLDGWPVDARHPANRREGPSNHEHPLASDRRASSRAELVSKKGSR